MLTVLQNLGLNQSGSKTVSSGSIDPFKKKRFGKDEKLRTTSWVEFLNFNCLKNIVQLRWLQAVIVELNISRNSKKKYRTFHISKDGLKCCWMLENIQNAVSRTGTVKQNRHSAFPDCDYLLSKSCANENHPGCVGSILFTTNETILLSVHFVSNNRQVPGYLSATYPAKYQYTTLAFQIFRFGIPFCGRLFIRIRFRYHLQKHFQWRQCTALRDH